MDKFRFVEPPVLHQFLVSAVVQKDTTISSTISPGLKQQRGPSLIPSVFWLLWISHDILSLCCDECSRAALPRRGSGLRVHLPCVCFDLPHHKSSSSCSARHPVVRLAQPPNRWCVCLARRPLSGSCCSQMPPLLPGMSFLHGGRSGHAPVRRYQCLLSMLSASIMDAGGPTSRSAVARQHDSPVSWISPELAGRYLQSAIADVPMHPSCCRSGGVLAIDRARGSVGEQAAGLEWSCREPYALPTVPLCSRAREFLHYRLLSLSWSFGALATNVGMKFTYARIRDWPY